MTQEVLVFFPPPPTASTRVPPGFHEVLRGLRSGASTKKSACCWGYHLSSFFFLPLFRWVQRETKRTTTRICRSPYLTHTHTHLIKFFFSHSLFKHPETQETAQLPKASGRRLRERPADLDLGCQPLALWSNHHFTWSWGWSWVKDIYRDS